MTDTLRIWLHIYNSTITPFLLLHTDNELLRETDGSFTKYDFLFLSEGRVAFFFLSVWSSILVTRGEVLEAWLTLDSFGSLAFIQQ